MKRLGEIEMAEKGRMVVVATDPRSGVLFAKSAASPEDVHAIMGREIFRLLEDFEGEVTFSGHEDGYGEQTIYAKYDNGEMELEYKICPDQC